LGVQIEPSMAAPGMKCPERCKLYNNSDLTIHPLFRHRFAYNNAHNPAIPSYCALIPRNEMQICFLSLAKSCALRPRIGKSQEVPKPWGGYGVASAHGQERNRHN